ncbi:BTAD domain-containing putative transcriptional regulator [Saccharothrix sp. NPDC042600]|uniref:BTAD domain-containing putative transcriptional regulator n=1 Tax=Saccharothrix TaxID=2071 RepID=UPI0033C66E11|nr:BTAD domain-containing putative transcriptional regulator [Saccharothrix mutabilis subsp. capreolus]
MRFGVLGPLAVWTSDARPVRIPELKVRALLAELVLEAGRVVPADRLVDHLWGQRLPANPLGALQTRVSQLRGALDNAEPGSRALVVSRPPGYLLDVPADDVDVRRFEALVAQAAAVGSARDRVALLGDALALWRGPALADFADEEFARVAAARLAELWLTAVEQRAEARLELGEQGVLADELGDLVERHPLRERLRAAHLRALYRAGRQGEALAGYRDFRSRLADELGMEPGPELAALHRAILAQDPALGGTRPVSASNLPHVLGELVGREDAVGAVRALPDRLVTLTGPGGVGKTRLALAAAWRAVEDFPDGVWLVELAGLPAGAGADAVAELVAAVVGVRDETSSGLLGHLADALRGKRLMVVLDNCEHVAPAVAEVVGVLLRTAPDVRVLATSQRPLGVAGEVLYAVPPLAEPSAVDLFVARAAAGSPGFALTPDNADAVAAICRRLDGVPLALELAATRVRALGVHELLARLDDRFRVLSAGHADAPARQRTLRAVIDWSWELLGEAERAVLRRLSVHADGWTLAAAEAVCGDDLDVLDLLARLVDRSLVTVSTVDGYRYRLLESVAEYSAAKLTESGERAEVERRHREYYTGLALRADARLRGPEQREWLRHLDVEAANLRAALDGAVREGTALPLVNALAWYWVLRGRLGEGRRALAAALAAGGAEDDAATARVWLAAFLLRMGENPDADGTAAPRPHDVDALAARARAEVFLAIAGVGIGEVRTGEDQLASALEVFQGLGDQWGVAASLVVRSRHALLRSDLATLTEAGTRAMELFTALGDRWGRLHATYALGWHAEIVGDYDRAAHVHRSGLRMAEDLGLWTDVSDKLGALGRIALLTGDLDRADDLHERARRVAVEQGYPVGEEFAELGLALSARRRGRFDEAEASLRKWLAWDRSLGSDIAQAIILAELGFTAEQRGDAEAARALHLDGLAAARRAADPRAVALAFEGLAGVAEPVEAARLLGRAAALRESVGAPLAEGERGDVTRITDRARAALGAETFAAEFARGRETPEPAGSGEPG